MRPGEELTKEEVLAYLDGRVAKWWLPDDVVFVDEIPKTSVGKFSKKDLRDKFAGYQLPDRVAPAALGGRHTGALLLRSVEPNPTTPPRAGGPGSRRRRSRRPGGRTALRDELVAAAVRDHARRTCEHPGSARRDRFADGRLPLGGGAP